MKLNWRSVFAVALPVMPLIFFGSWLAAPDAEAAPKPAPSAVSASGSSGFCPLSASLATSSAAPPRPVVSNDRSCLVDAKNLGRSATVFDIRDRSDFVQFHIPGAENLPFGALTAMPKPDAKPVVIYDSGRFRSDAYSLCSRLRSVGIEHVKVLDGGIAAWAQMHAPAQMLALNRLSDSDMPAALSDVEGGPVVLSASLRSALRQFGIKALPTPATRSSRTVLLADDTTSLSAIQAQLAKSRTAFYWVGTAERLQTLLGTHLAQDRKRMAGPAESRTCGAL